MDGVNKESFLVDLGDKINSIKHLSLVFYSTRFFKLLARVELSIMQLVNVAAHVTGRHVHRQKHINRA